MMKKTRLSIKKIKNTIYTACLLGACIPLKLWADPDLPSSQVKEIFGEKLLDYFAIDHFAINIDPNVYDAYLETDFITNLNIIATWEAGKNLLGRLKTLLDARINWQNTNTLGENALKVNLVRITDKYRILSSGFVLDVAQRTDPAILCVVTYRNEDIEGEDIERWCYDPKKGKLTTAGLASPELSPYWGAYLLANALYYVVSYLETRMPIEAVNTPLHRGLIGRSNLWESFFSTPRMKSLVQDIPTETLKNVIQRFYIDPEPAKNLLGFESGDLLLGEYVLFQHFFPNCLPVDNGIPHHLGDTAQEDISLVEEELLVFNQLCQRLFPHITEENDAP